MYVLWSKMSSIWMVRLIMWPDHLKIRQKRVQKVKCLSFWFSLFRWLQYLIIIEPKLFNILKIFKSFQFADSVWSQIECSDAGILVQIFQNLNTVVRNVQLLQGWQLLQVLELKLIRKFSGGPIGKNFEWKPAITYSGGLNPSKTGNTRKMMIWL